MNIPNALTLSRLAAIPLLMWLLGARFPGHDMSAAVLFVVFSLTDTVDGNLARRFGRVTELGKFLDPLADKLFVLSILIGLVQEGLVAAWVVVIIFSRELVITILRSVGAGQGRLVAATAWGKTKTVTQLLAILLLILQRPYPWLAVPAAVAIAVAAVFTVLSGLDYVWQFRRVLDWRPSAPEPVTGLEPVAERVRDAFQTVNLSLGLAESCTGGLAAELVTSVPGSGEYFLGSLVTYSNQAKEELLGVPREILERYGAVSEQTARAMAEGALARLGSDVAVSITGLAGPSSDGTSKPVGLVYFGVAVRGSGTTICEERQFSGDRPANRRESALTALQLAVDAAGRLTDGRVADQPITA